MQNVGSPPDLNYKASQKLKQKLKDKLNISVAYKIQNASAFSFIMHYAFYILHYFNV
jgi:hypothetical protein